MLWDERPDSWRHYNTGNPSLILMDGAGETRVERVSRFDANRLQEALDGLG